MYGVNQYRVIFDLFDANKNGTISVSELGTCLRALGKNPSICELNEIMKKADTNRNGKIEFNEFCGFVNECKSEITIGQLIESLAIFDTNKKGYLTIKEFSDLLSKSGEPLTKDEISKIVTDADKNKDGKIDYQEFASVLLMPPKVFNISEPEKNIVPCVPQEGAHINTFEEYLTMYKESLNNSDEFWSEKARQFLTWFSPFETVLEGGLKEGDFRWFVNGKLNACYNCVDRHLETRANQVALLWEGDEPNEIRKVTYQEMFEQVCLMANVLKSLGVNKGDAVCIYLPMIPETLIAMLACARIGAPHSVVFAGFSSEALRDRINDCQAKILFTSDEGCRNGKRIPLKKMADKALEECKSVQNVIVYKRTGAEVPFNTGKDLWWNDVIENQRPYCICETMDSEDPLFYLYTSGSTGKPKGIMHTTAGYLLFTSMTTKYVFDVREGEIFACMADIGWITGHSYILYGPLLNGYTSFIFESVPTYPDPGRYWDCVQRHKINILYTAPTAIRALMRFGDEPVMKYDRSSLRILGTVGEPINPQAWNWYFNVVGEKRCPIMDTYWQTETGGHIITPLPCFDMKPGSASYPFFGIEPAIYDEKKELEGDASGMLVIKRPWPGLARTIFGDHQRFKKVYLSMFPSTYFTGDGAKRDSDGFYWITGRIDDVLNVSGHRIGTAEVESALVAHPAIAESAVIGITHDIKGQAMFAYCIPREGYTSSPQLIKELITQCRSSIGAFAAPDHILITPNLPKTRSGKIMRRILRKIASNESDQLGDISTLAQADVVETLIKSVKEYFKNKK